VPLTRMNAELFGGKAAYWQEIVDHTAYDEFWKKRSLWKFMDGVKCAVLNVGGWFDAEDPMGPLRVYGAVEKKNPATPNLLVMGPWSHGGWGRGPGNTLGNLNFAVNTGEFFREHIQFPFFMEYLKDKPAKLPEAWMFLTGLNEWRRHDAWPPKDLTATTMYLDAGGKLSLPPEGGSHESRDERCLRKVLMTRATTPVAAGWPRSPRPPTPRSSTTPPGGIAADSDTRTFHSATARRPREPTARSAPDR